MFPIENHQHVCRTVSARACQWAAPAASVWPGISPCFPSHLQIPPYNHSKVPYHFKPLQLILPPNSQRNMDVLRKEFIKFLPTVLPLSSSTAIISLSSSSVKEESLTHQRPTPASLWPSLPSSMVILLNWLPFLSPESSTSLSTLPPLFNLKQTNLPRIHFPIPPMVSSSSHEIYWKSILYTWPPVSLLLFLSSCSIVRALARVTNSLPVAKVRGFRSLSPLPSQHHLTLQISCSLGL